MGSEVAAEGLLQCPAPDFELANQFGEPVRLTALRGRPVVVVFYPFAFSGVCTSELDELAGAGEFLERSGARLLAVSCDSKYTLRAYAQERGYAFDLLSDFWPHGRTAEAYRAFDPERGRPLRASFVIRADGIISAVIRSDAGTPRPLSSYRNALDSLGSLPGKRG